jgi:DNA-binding GntR family transcriptional regulator
MSSTLSDEVYSALADAIVSGEFSSGQKLDEPSICRRFNVSRTPVREALRRLSGAGLVEIVPGRSVVVRRIDVDQLTDMFDALAEMEGLCALLSADRMTPLERRRLVIATEELSRKRASKNPPLAELNQQFHNVIYLGTHNVSLAENVQSFRLRLAPFQVLQFVPAITTRTFEDHKLIADAIVARKPAEAQVAMRDHITRTSLMVIDHFAAQSGDVHKISAG